LKFKTVSDHKKDSSRMTFSFIFATLDKGYSFAKVQLHITGAILAISTNKNNPLLAVFF